MIRVLQLRPLASDYETASGSTALAEDGAGPARHEVRTIGRGGTYAQLVRAALALRREPPACDIVHAWGFEPLALAVAGTRASLPIILSTTEPPTAKQVRWLRAIGDHRDVQVVCPTDTIRRRFVERGVPIARCHLIRPGLSFARIRRRRDAAMRARLGLSPADRVTLAVGESTRAAAHHEAVFAITLLNVMDRTNRILVWGRGDHSASVRRFAEKLAQPSFVDARQALGREPIAFEDLLCAADEVLVTARQPVPTLPIAVCMAAGLPIISTVTPTVAELLEDRHTALMTGKALPRMVARRVLDLRDDPSLQWSLSDMARTEAYEFFSLTRFLHQFREVYELIASGRTVQLTPPRAGAGLRFHGRA